MQLLGGCGAGTGGSCACDSWACRLLRGSTAVDVSPLTRAPHQPPTRPAWPDPCSKLGAAVASRLPPILILHGTADKSVPMEIAVEFVAALRVGWGVACMQAGHRDALARRLGSCLHQRHRWCRLAMQRAVPHSDPLPCPAALHAVGGEAGTPAARLKLPVFMARWPASAPSAQTCLQPALPHLWRDPCCVLVQEAGSPARLKLYKERTHTRPVVEDPSERWGERGGARGPRRSISTAGRPRGYPPPVGVATGAQQSSFRMAARAAGVRHRGTPPDGCRSTRRLHDSRLGWAGPP